MNNLGLLLSLILTLTGTQALAWGIKDHAVKWIQNESSLFVPALRDGEIQYCLQTQSSRFKKSFLKVQIESAMKVWLQGTGDEKMQSVRLRSVECDDVDVDLKVVVGSVPVFEHMAYHTASVTPDKKRFIQEIYLSTEYACQIPAEPHVAGFAILDDLGPRMASTPDGLRQALERLQQDPTLNLHTHARQMGLSYTQLYCSFYPTILHELGHAFGLCDLYGNHLKSQCSRRHRTSLPAEAVMLHPIWYSLRADDVAGIKALLAFVRKSTSLL